MSTSALLRGCLTALAVAVVLGMLRRAGPRYGGLAAAIPVTSVPALAWACWEQGPGFAAASATAALLATGMTGLFALLYAFAARRLAPWRALATAALPAVLLTGMVSGLGGSLTMSLVGACLMLVACRQLMPNATPARRRVVHWRRDLLLTMAVSGAVTILMSLIAPRVPPLLCGLVAAIPVVGMSTTVSVHAQGGSGTVTAFLQAYVQGLFAKVAFLGALAATLQLSAGPWPWLVAVAGGTAVVMVVSKWPWPTAPAEEPASCAAEPAPPALSPPPTLSAARPG